MHDGLGCRGVSVEHSQLAARGRVRVLDNCFLTLQGHLPCHPCWILAVVSAESCCKLEKAAKQSDELHTKVVKSSQTRPNEPINDTSGRH